MCSQARRLIVNGDDFGQDAAFNRGIVRAHDEGILTSASLMVRWPAAAEAVALAKERSSLSLGLHLDFGEWVYSDGSWTPLYEVVDVSDADRVRAEVDGQVAAFVKLTGQPPTHLDSHQHVHLQEPARSAITEVARRLGVPLRGLCASVRYLGDFYGQDGTGNPYPSLVSVESLRARVAGLPAGVTEMGCHPADGLSEFPTPYREERVTELQTLVDPAVRATLVAENVELITFTDVAQQA